MLLSAIISPLKLKPIPFERAKYHPASLVKFRDVPLYSIIEWVRVVDWNAWPPDLLQKILDMEEGEIITGVDPSIVYVPFDIAHYTLSIGKDSRGPYLSIFDIWDFDEGYSGRYSGQEGIKWHQRLEPWALNLMGEPFGIYDRIYLDEEEIRSQLDSGASPRWMGARRFPCGFYSPLPKEEAKALVPQEGLAFNREKIVTREQALEAIENGRLGAMRGFDGSIWWDFGGPSAPERQASSSIKGEKDDVSSPVADPQSLMFEKRLEGARTIQEGI